MTIPLPYATSHTGVLRPLWHRAIVMPLYYLGWTIGGGVAGTWATAITADALEVPWFTGAPALYFGGSVCAAGGAAIAHLTRRRRWPQGVAAAVGGIGTMLAAWAVYDMLRMPRGFLWDFFFRINLILLGGAIAMLLGGVAGIVLTRRR